MARPTRAGTSRPWNSPTSWSAKSAPACAPFVPDADARAQERTRITRTRPDLGDRGGEATALNEAATLHQLSSEPAEAEACHQRALELARATGSARDGAHAQPAWAVAPR